MKVVSGIPTTGVAAATPVAEAARTEAVAPATTSRAAGGDALQSAVLQPAIDALRQLPDVDQVKVAALRDALAKGDLPFDPAKLAVLIERYHRGVK